MREIRYCRQRAGFSQQELARRAALTQAALARIELGRVSPRIATVRRLLEACGMTLELHLRAGTGIDRTAIRRMMALSPAQRLELAAREARNLARLLR